MIACGSSWSSSGRGIAKTRVVRPGIKRASSDLKVDDADVALADAEEIARDDRLRIELVELGPRDRQDARREAGDQARELLVPLHVLRRRVVLDRSVVDARAPQRGRRRGDVVRVAE